MTHDTPPKRIWASTAWAKTFETPDERENAHSYTLTSEAEAMIAAALESSAYEIAELAEHDAAERGWRDGERLARKIAADIRSRIPQPASAALDRAILEAKTEVAAILGVTTARDTMTGEPVMWGDEDGDCLTPEIAVQCALDKLIAEAEARGMERAAKICDRRAGNASDFDRYTRRAAGMCASDIRAAKGDPT